MTKSKCSKYYDKDYRIPTAILSVVSLLPILVIICSIAVFFFNWKVGAALLILTILAYKPMLKFCVVKSQEWSKFCNEASIDSKIIYGDIESPERAEKFNLIGMDYGGIFREESEMVLGSIKSEKRCAIQDFSMEIRSKGSIVGYLLVNMGNHVFAFTPKWDGDLDEHPIATEKAAWALSEIQAMMDAGAE